MNAIRNVFCMGLLTSLVAAPSIAATPAPTAAAKAARPTPAAEAPPALPQLGLEQLVDRNLKARGGAAAWQHVQAMTFSGKMDAGRERKDGGVISTNPALTRAENRARGKLILEGKDPAPAPKIIQLPFTMDVARPNRMRMEIQFSGQTALQVYDGKQGWKVRPFLGRREVESYTEDELRQAQDQQEFDGPLVNASAKGIKVALDGTERVDGRPAYRLKLTLKNGDTRRLWIDGETFLDARFEGPPRRWNGKLRPVYTTYRDYKPVAGLQVAHTLETTIEGEKNVERIIIDKVAVDPTLPADHFARPK